MEMMRGRGWLLVSSVLVAFSVSCGDDDEQPAAMGTGGTGGSGASAEARCKGVYDDLTEAQLLAEVSDEGACVTRSDVTAVCRSDVNTQAASCGIACYSQSSDPEVQGQCSLDCVKGALSPRPSDACITCYVESVVCARDNCLSVCLADPASAECTQCRVDHGCSADFYQCSGLPTPSGVDLGHSAGGTGTD